MDGDHRQESPGPAAGAADDGHDTVDASAPPGQPRRNARSLLKDSAYAAIGLGDALAEAVRSLPPAEETVESLRSWATERAESAGRGFNSLVRRGRRTLGSAPLDQPRGRRQAAPDSERNAEDYP